MNFDYSDVQQMLLESADRLMAASGTVEAWRARRAHSAGFDEPAWQQFAELGWLALPIPEAAGGLGGTMEDIALLMTSLGKGLSIEPYVSSAVIGGHVIANSNRTDLLDDLAAGRLRIALAHGEGTDCFDIVTPRATVARSTDGAYVLSGRKTLVFDAPSATKFIVSASLDDAAATALLLVDCGAPGVTCEPYPLIDGSHAADITFDAVSLPKAALLASGGQALDLLEAAVDRAIVALMGQAVGAMEAAIEICAAYMKERKQFGQPIGKFQALQHLAVDMLVAAHQARSMLYQAIANIGGDADARKKAVSFAKVVIGQAAQVVSRGGIQIHGGYGLTDEYAIGHYHRRLMVLEKAYGDIEHHVARLAG